MLSSPTACTFNTGARYLEYAAGAPVNYTGDISTVFACLASNLGTGGCGYQHLLQAFEFALIAKGIGNEEQQVMFLRPAALLGLVFLTDDDDCSAALNTGFFQAQLPGELPTLRCATLPEAVTAAAHAAQPGDTVLLSPACASLDMFRDYTHRGDEFAAAVRSLAA